MTQEQIDIASNLAIETIKKQWLQDPRHNVEVFGKESLTESEIIDNFKDEWTWFMEGYKTMHEQANKELAEKDEEIQDLVIIKIDQELVWTKQVIRIQDLKNTLIKIKTYIKDEPNNGWYFHINKTINEALTSNQLQ